MRGICVCDSGRLAILCFTTVILSAFTSTKLSRIYSKTAERRFMQLTKAPQHTLPKCEAGWNVSASNHAVSDSSALSSILILLHCTQRQRASRGPGPHCENSGPLTIPVPGFHALMGSSSSAAVLTPSPPAALVLSSKLHSFLCPHF